MGIRVSTVPYGTIIIIEHAKRYETMVVVEIRRNRLPFTPSDRKSRIFSGSEDVDCVFQLTKRKFTAILTILSFRSKFDAARNSFCHISIIFLVIVNCEEKLKMIRESYRYVTFIFLSQFSLDSCCYMYFLVLLRSCNIIFVHFLRSVA